MAVETDHDIQVESSAFKLGFGSSTFYHGELRLANIVLKNGPLASLVDGNGWGLVYSGFLKTPAFPVLQSGVSLQPYVKAGLGIESFKLKSAYDFEDARYFDGSASNFRIEWGVGTIIQVGDLALFVNFQRVEKDWSKLRRPGIIPIQEKDEQSHKFDDLINEVTYSINYWF